MSEKLDSSSATSRQNAPRVHRHPVILRVSSIVVGGVLSVLMLTAVVPPIVADQSDRAVVNAPITLLTAPIDGEIDTLPAAAGRFVGTGDVLARISNVRLDRGTLISLEEKVGDARSKLEATQAKRMSDRAYLTSLDAEIVGQTEQLKTQFQSQIVELRARVAESESLSGEKKALVDRQTNMVARDAASMDMLRPTTQQYSATLHKSDAERAKLNQKVEQLNALEKGIFVGDDLVALATLAQKRRDIDLDARRLEIEERELSAVLADKEDLINTERKRLTSLAEASIMVPSGGKILNVGAAPGRHVNAGDSVASLVDCENRFVVAIFSYRQGQSMKVGTRVSVDGALFGSGVVTAILPKTSDKTDERFAVPFPQTERRELYAIITPDSLTANAIATNTAAGNGQPATSCAVGQWVTVTKNDGIVPSMSVTWRRLETLVTSWGSNKTPVQPASDVKRRETGIAVLAAAFHSDPQAAQRFPQLDEWLPRTDTVVSR
jgi:multidrug resistance efflux pump